MENAVPASVAVVFVLFIHSIGFNAAPPPLVLLLTTARVCRVVAGVPVPNDGVVNSSAGLRNK